MSPNHNEYRRIELALINMLADLPLLHDIDGCGRLVYGIRQRLGSVKIESHREPRTQAVEIIRSCLPVPGGIAAVVAEISLHQPDEVLLAPFRRLRDEYDALDVLGEDSFAQLRGALADLRPPQLSWLYQQATDHDQDSPPLWCQTAWELYVHLVGHNVLRDGVPPEMVFLALLEQQVDSATATVIRRRNQARATELAVTAQFDHRRARVLDGPEVPLDPFAYVVIQIDPDQEPEASPSSTERYTLSLYRQWQGDEGWHSQLCEQVRHVPYPRLAERVAEMVRQTERVWADWRVTIVVELVLPRLLLNEDVGWWVIDRHSEDLPERVLAMNYPVVVRSLDRLRQEDWHLRWKAKWERLQAAPELAQVHFSQPNGAHYVTRLEAELNADPHRTCLVLSAPPRPGPAGLHEIMTALRAGLPVILWHREQAASPPLWEEIQDMTAAGRITGLPMQIYRARLAALQADPTQGSCHFGRHIAVLWDDPERKPELDAASAFEGVVR